MKKALLFFLIFISFGLIFIIKNYDEKVVIQNFDKNNFITTNSLTMMYETDAGSGEYQISNDNLWPQEGYIFNEELSKCENGSKIIWDNENKKVLLQANKSDKCYVYFDIELTLVDICNGKTLAECITTEIYTGVDGENDLYFHDGVGSYTNADQEDGDNSYRYSGANPNNYICFGSDKDICSHDNLYRIIGVFNNQVKLIKYDYGNSDLLGTNGDYSDYTYSELWGNSSYYKGNLDISSLYLYFWNKNTCSSTWSESGLNTVNLNTNYINNIGSTWSNLIATTIWPGGGIEFGISEDIKTIYDEEKSSAFVPAYEAKIGLMYLSDYIYAAKPDNWTINQDLYNTNNWMNMGLREWTLSNDVVTMSQVYYVDSFGKAGLSIACDSSYSLYAVRPVFFLKSDVELSGGSGTVEDPYRLSV